jgi:FERM/RhoGEF/pleckstrin domain protein 2
VHGEYQLKNIQVEDGNAHINIPNSFTIYSSNRSLLVAAVSSEEKSKWLQDLYEAIEKAKGYDEDNKCNFSTFKSNSSSDNNLDSIGVRDLVEQADSSIDNHNHTLAWSASEHSNKHHLMNNQHRINTTMHVCWHRNTSVGSDDIHKSLVNQMSGYLLRKFKNSNGWQKLWVVFTNFCLFFYKTYQVSFADY